MPVHVMELDRQDTAVLISAPLNKYETEKLRSPRTRYLTGKEKDDLAFGNVAGIMSLFGAGFFIITAINATTVGGMVAVSIFALAAVLVAIVCLVEGIKTAALVVKNSRINNANPDAKITRLSDDRRWLLLEQAFEVAKLTSVWERLLIELGRVSDLSNKLATIVEQYLQFSDNQFALLDENLPDADEAKVLEQRSRLVHKTAVAIKSAIDTAQAQELEQQRLELESAEAYRANRNFELSQRVLRDLMVNDPLIDEIGRS